jgi:hypothetical protein
MRKSHLQTEQQALFRSLIDRFRADTNCGLKSSHAYELVSAYFGYKSHIALKSDKDFSLSAAAGVAWIYPTPGFGAMDRRRDSLHGLPEGLPGNGHLAAIIYRIGNSL